MSETLLTPPASAEPSAAPAPEAKPVESTTPEQIITPPEDRDWTKAINPDGTFTQDAHKWGVPEQWKSPGAIIDSYKNLQKMKGAPGEEATPEQLSAYRQANGIPEVVNLESYGVQLSDEMKEIVPEETLGEILKVANESAHLGHTPMVNAMVSKYAEITEGIERQLAEQTVEEQKAALEASKQTLHSDPNFQGDKMTAAIQTATNGLNSSLEALGEDPNSDAAKEVARNPLMVRILHYFASKMGQDSTNLGNPVADLRSGEEQADDIINNPANPLHKPYHDGDVFAQKKVLSLMGAK